MDVDAVQKKLQFENEIKLLKAETSNAEIKFLQKKIQLTKKQRDYYTFQKNVCEAQRDNHLSIKKNVEKSLQQI